MSHSTHGGFSDPPTCSDSGLELRSNVSRLAFRGVTRPPCDPSVETGVGHKFRCAFHLRIDGAIMLAFAVGVGRRTAIANGVPAPLPLMPFAFSLSRLASKDAGSSVKFITAASGVGHDPDAVSPVRGADGGSWDTVPDRIIPERGKVSANGCHPETKQAWDVLHDDETGS
jgi:hypothetical protein